MLERFQGQPHGNTNLMLLLHFHEPMGRFVMSSHWCLKEHVCRLPIPFIIRDPLNDHECKRDTCICSPFTFPQNSTHFHNEDAYQTACQPNMDMLCFYRAWYVGVNKVVTALDGFESTGKCMCGNALASSWHKQKRRETRFTLPIRNAGMM